MTALSVLCDGSINSFSTMKLKPRYLRTVLLFNYCVSYILQDTYILLIIKIKHFLIKVIN